MNKNDIEYRYWLKKHNEKNLVRRTRQRRYKCLIITKQIKYNRELKTSANYVKEIESVKFSVPINFSIISNVEETATFFDELISFICKKQNYGKKIYIDFSNTEELTIDALMYLLAIINSINLSGKKRYFISGNAPKSERARRLFESSGFYKYVKRTSDVPIFRDEDNVQIVSDTKCTTAFAKQISEFVFTKAGVGKIQCQFLYNMIIEMMSNTHKHAYNESDSILYPRWYCFAEYDKDRTISFTFVDIGDGIPATVHKNFAEKIDILGLKSESKYLESTLNGDFRTSTLLPYRGKGLPSIKETCFNGLIKNMRIITSKADVLINNSEIIGKDNNTSIKGTVFYWQIDILRLKGEIA